MWQQFTEDARKVVYFAQEEAGALGANDVDTEHLLLGLIHEPNSDASQILGNLGVSVKAIRKEVEGHTKRVPVRSSEDMRLTPSAKQAIDFAYGEAKGLTRNYIGSEHILIGVLRAHGLGGKALTAVGASLQRLRGEAAKVQPPIDRSINAEDIEKKKALPVEILPRQGLQSKSIWQRYNHDAHKAVFYAQELAVKNGDNYVSVNHMLLGLIRDSDSVASGILERLKIPPSIIRSQVEYRLQPGEGRTEEDIRLGPDAKRAVDFAYNEARNLASDYIGTEHLLLGLLREEVEGSSGTVLTKLGADLETARAAVRKLQSGDAGTT